MGSSTGTLLVDDDGGVRDILQAIRRRAAFHSEDEYRLRERQGLRIEGDARSHPVWRDEVAALTCTQRLVRLAHETGKRIHVRVSTAQEMEFLAGHKDIASVETTPHHLTLEAPDCHQRLGTYAQMNPPVRDAAHREGVAGSDARRGGRARVRPRPAYARGKNKAYPASPSGMTGVQTLVPIMLDWR